MTDGARSPRAQRVRSVWSASALTERAGLLDAVDMNFDVWTTDGPPRGGLGLAEVAGPGSLPAVRWSGSIQSALWKRPWASAACSFDHGTPSVYERGIASTLGIDIADFGGHEFVSTPGGSTTWAIFEPDTTYFGPPGQSYMINFRVDDLGAMRAQLLAAGVEVVEEIAEHESGKFGWAYDGEGNRFELWEPALGH